MNGYCFQTTTFEIENQEGGGGVDCKQRTIANEGANERTSLAVILLVDRDRGAQEEEVGSKPVRHTERV